MGYTVIMHSGELYHHGILGQKWGKRNGPPYPLDANDHSAAERKAGWRKSLGNKINAAAQSNAKRMATKIDAKQAYKSGKIDKATYKAKLKEANKQNWKEHGEMLGPKKSRLDRAADAAQRDADNLRKAGYKKEADAVQKVADRNREKAAKQAEKKATKERKPIDREKAKKAAKAGAVVAGTLLVGYGMYKISKNMDAQIDASKLRTQRNNEIFKTLSSQSAKNMGAISNSISRGEQSTLAIFDNLSSGHNRSETIAKLTTPGSKNPLASKGADLLESARTAEKAGVSSSDILKSISDIDDFFMDKKK